jgi:hypothetical protein
VEFTGMITLPFIIYYYTLLFFIHVLNFSPEWSITEKVFEMSMKLHRWIDLIEEECCAKNDNSTLYYF